MTAADPENSTARFTDFPWEFGYIVDRDLRDTGFAVVRGRPYLPMHFELLDSLKREHHIIGITCQGVFPMIGGVAGNVPDERGLRDGRDEAYVKVVEGWAHCFRSPELFLPAGLPRVLFSNSDNMDPDWVWRMAAKDGPLKTKDGPLKKRWDFVYTCMPDRSNLVRKNWEFAKRCALRFAEELGLHGALVGVADVDGAPEHPRLDLFPAMKWSEFIRIVGQSHVAFFPNTWDPSPRVMAEAMCLDVALLVNEAILGGWKYVNTATGRFFKGERDVLAAMVGALSRPRYPRDWYCANYGRKNAGPRLADFLRMVAPEDRAIAQLESASFFSPRDYKAMPRPRALPLER